VQVRGETSSLIFRAAGLLALGATLGLVVGAARPGGLQLVAAPRAASCEAPAAAPTLISPAEAAHVCAVSGALIADARIASDYAAGHIAGAVHLPCNAAGELAGAALAHLEDRALVLVYGASTQEALDVATSIARRLPSGGGPKIYALDGGFAAWEKAGLACASGPCEDCAVAPVSR
jgi:rhodanese-related sulfurtransferase